MDRTITLQQLYRFVTAYVTEAREENFTPSVGDFVDWIASRGEGQEECLHSNTVKVVNSTMIDSYCPDCNNLVNPRPKSSTQEDKPVLPEKLGIHQSRDHHDPDEMLDIALETQDTVNKIIDYLKAKNL